MMCLKDYLQYEIQKKREKQRSRKADKQRSREKQKAEKQRSWKSRKQRSKEAGKAEKRRSGEEEKWRSREAKNYKSREASRIAKSREAEKQRSRKTEIQKTCPKRGKNIIPKINSPPLTFEGCHHPQCHPRRKVFQSPFGRVHVGWRENSKFSITIAHPSTHFLPGTWMYIILYNYSSY